MGRALSELVSETTPDLNEEGTFLFIRDASALRSQAAVSVRAVLKEIAREAIKLIDFRAFSGLKKFDLMQTAPEISVLWPIPIAPWELFAIVCRAVNFTL